MPFTSQRQLQTCFGREAQMKSKGGVWKWDCKKWLAETPDPGCLPTVKGGEPKRACRKLRASEKVPSKVYQGPRGGRYFFVAGVKVYVPRG